VTGRYVRARSVECASSSLLFSPHQFFEHIGVRLYPVPWEGEDAKGMTQIQHESQTT